MSRTPRTTRTQTPDATPNATPNEETNVTATETAPTATPTAPAVADTSATPTATPTATLVYGSAVLDSMVTRYATADASGKAKIRAALDRIKSDLVRSMIATTDPALQATIIGDLANVTRATDACVTAPKAVRTVDYTALVRDRIIALVTAADALASGTLRPVDVPADHDLSDAVPADMVTALSDLFTAITAGDVTDDQARTASAFATSKVDVITRAAKRDTAAHIVDVLAATPGTFRSVAAIAKGTSATYGDDHPSSGAVSAALFATSAADRMPTVTAYKAGATLPDGTKATRDGAIYVPDTSDMVEVDPADQDDQGDDN